MYAVRQIKRIKNRMITIHLPDDFPGEQVEIILLPFRAGAEPVLVNEEMYHFMSREISQMTPDQQRAYEQARQTVQHGRQPGEPRVLGALSGLLQTSDDFDAPLPDEAAFWGEDSDEYGLNPRT